MSVYFNRHQIPRLPYPLRTTKSSQTGGVCPTVVQTSFLDLISYWPTQYHSMSSQCYILSLVAVKKHLRCLPPRALQHQRPLPCVPWIQTPPSGARSVCHYLPLYATWPPKKKTKVSSLELDHIFDVAAIWMLLTSFNVGPYHIISCQGHHMIIWIIGQSFHFASMFWRSEVCPPHHGWPRLSFVQRPPMCRHRQHLQHQTVKVLHKELPPTTGRTHKTKLNPSLRTITSHDNLGNAQWAAKRGRKQK